MQSDLMMISEFWNNEGEKILEKTNVHGILYGGSLKHLEDQE
jgi:hypothetical protein